MSGASIGKYNELTYKGKLIKSNGNVFTIEMNRYSDGALSYKSRKYGARYIDLNCMSDIINEVEKFEREKKMFEFTNQIKKNSLINDIKNGLGDEIKSIKGKPRIIKKPWHTKLKNLFIKFFNKF